MKYIYQNKNLIIYLLILLFIFLIIINLINNINNINNIKMTITFYTLIYVCLGSVNHHYASNPLNFDSHLIIENVLSCMHASSQ